MHVYVMNVCVMYDWIMHAYMHVELSKESVMMKSLLRDRQGFKNKTYDRYLDADELLMLTTDDATDHGLTRKDPFAGGTLQQTTESAPGIAVDQHNDSADGGHEDRDEDEGHAVHDSDYDKDKDGDDKEDDDESLSFGLSIDGIIQQDADTSTVTVDALMTATETGPDPIKLRIHWLEVERGDDDVVLV